MKIECKAKFKTFYPVGGIYYIGFIKLRKLINTQLIHKLRRCLFISVRDRFGR